MKKFEYHVVSLVRDGLKDFNLTEFLNARGEEGWELIHVSYNQDFREFIFKQEIEPSTETEEKS